MDEIRRLCNELVRETQQVLRDRYQEGYNAGYEAGYVKGQKNYNNSKKLVIPAEEELFGTMVNLAVRQAAHRSDSYMQLIQFLMPILPFLSYRTLWVMEQDILALGFEQSTEKARETWKKFLIHVRVQMSHKKP